MNAKTFLCDTMPQRASLTGQVYTEANGRCQIGHGPLMADVAAQTPSVVMGNFGWICVCRSLIEIGELSL